MSLPEMFEAQVARTPDAVAVIGSRTRLTYDEVNRRANRLARHLVSLGAGPETVVAVVLPRRPDVLVALLAVLKSGAAYLPVDPANPRARIDALVADAGARIVLDERAFPAGSDRLPDDEDAFAVGPDRLPDGEGASPVPDRLPDSDLGLPVHPHQAAYLIYTSGSTGRPKGVVVEHGSLAAYLGEAVAMYPAASGESLVHTSLAFDMPVTTLFTPLVTGGRVRFGDLNADTPSPGLLKVTPSHLRLLESLPNRVSDAANLVIGGEALDGTMLGAWRARHPEAVVINEYGPTEATVGCVVHRLEPGDALDAGPVPIGRPSATHGCTCWTSISSPSPTGCGASCISRAPDWRAATPGGPDRAPSGSSPTRTARPAPGCTGSATGPAGTGPECWSTPDASTNRSRSAATGSSPARSRPR
ncbi:amino acid adenylation domain-containing protein [Streptomyces sp. LBUM 1486]|nr:amino acid adenylation domain-containing protein [Streptomyces sp. LBUM 1486]